MTLLQLLRSFAEGSVTHKEVTILIAIQLLLGHIVVPLGSLGEFVAHKVVVGQFHLLRSAWHQRLQSFFLHFPQLLARLPMELQHVSIGLAAGILQWLEVDLLHILVERLRKVTVLADVAGFLIAQLSDNVVRSARWKTYPQVYIYRIVTKLCQQHRHRLAIDILEISCSKEYSHLACFLARSCCFFCFPLNGTFLRL